MLHKEKWGHLEARNVEMTRLFEGPFGMDTGSRPLTDSIPSSIKLRIFRGTKKCFLDISKDYIKQLTVSFYLSFWSYII